MPINVALILGLIFGIIATVASFIFITPESRRKGMNKWLLILHNIFNFKSLLIEKIMRFLYVFLTICSVFIGFFMLFSGVSLPYGGGFQSFFMTGLVTMIILPIILRLLFEGMMLKIIQARDISEINKKMKGGAPAPRRPRPQQDDYNTGYQPRQRAYDPYQDQ